MSCPLQCSRPSASVLVCLFFLGTTQALSAADPKVEPFEQTGMILNTADLFPAAYKTVRSGARPADAGLSSRAFVTAEGVYAFLESPENQTALAKAPLNLPLRLKGRLLAAGSLLHVEAVGKVQSSAGRIDLTSLKKEQGKSVTLAGRNLCQCALNVADLPHSCKLGHLHHLQTGDGGIYHYLPLGDGHATLLGQGSHQKSVRVKARLFPGNYLLVEEAKVGP